MFIDINWYLVMYWLSGVEIDNCILTKTTNDQSCLCTHTIWLCKCVSGHLMNSQGKCQLVYYVEEIMQWIWFTKTQSFHNYKLISLYVTCSNEMSHMSVKLILRKHRINMQRWFSTILTFCHQHLFLSIGNAYFSSILLLFSTFYSLFRHIT